MARGKRGKDAADRELDEVRALASAPMTAETVARVRSALGSARSLVVARAAQIVKDHALDGFGKDLAGAFQRFLSDPVKRDPGCHAKLAAIEALDYVHHPDPDPFVIAARHLQLEPAWGPPVDTATALRARAVVALARLGYPDLVLLAAERLADPDSPVRQAAAEALALYGDRAGAGVLILAIRRGDADSLVTTACLVALLALAPPWGLAEARARLGSRDAMDRDVAALALGQSHRDDALSLLLDSVRATPLPRDRAPLYRAIGLHRSERAIDTLIDVVTDGSTPDARAALEALAPRRFDLGVRARVERAARERGLADAFAELFYDD